MKIYLVGGAVRDELMGVSGSDRDWVVVGATPEDLIFEGYTPVGKDFPVFLHPQTGEEYALARTERKTAPGYHGFVFHADPSITLEEDLARRDLTINAIAKDMEGQLIDPFKGVDDIKNRIFRHVSPAFKEDPVRILRLARFAARYPEFTTASETQALLKQMCEDGEVDALVSERIWQEISKGLMSNSPYKMLEVLLECGALEKLFPDLCQVELSPAQLLDIKKALEWSSWLQAPLPIRFAVLDFLLPVADQLKAPKDCTELADLLKANFERISICTTFSAKEILELLQSCDAFRRPERFDQLLIASECVSTIDKQKPESTIHISNTLNNLPDPYPQKIHLMKMLKSALSIDHKVIASEAINNGLVAAEIGKAIEDARLNVLIETIVQLKTPQNTQET